jgi:hypothetical protein
MNTDPNTIFNHLLILGFNSNERVIINGGITMIKEAINKIVGLFRTFSPLIKLSTFPGVYNSK